MKTRYFLTSNIDFTCYTGDSTLKGIIDKYLYVMRENKKLFGEANYKDFSIYSFKYNPKTVLIDFDMSGDVFFFDKIKGEGIDCENLEKHGIKQREIKKDFLFHNRTKC